MLPLLVAILRVVSAQLIVWHHLAFYGPLSDLAYDLMPEAITWLSRHARMAVQIFFVLGGYTAGRALAPDAALGPTAVVQRMARRYRRIAGPYLVALGLAIVANAIAGRLMTHETIAEPPTMDQLGAHVLLLQDVLEYPALTVGIWYLAIDLQLYLITLLLLTLSGWMARRAGPSTVRRAAEVSVLSLAAASHLWLNRMPELDAWGPYFFGSYALGLLVAWRTREQASDRALHLAFGVVLVGLALEWRPRPAIAAATAGLLLLAARAAEPRIGPRLRGVIDYLGRSTYSLFLVHFPVCLLVSAAFMRAGLTEPPVALAGMFAAWAASLGVAALFYRVVEGGRRTTAP